MDRPETSGENLPLGLFGYCEAVSLRKLWDLLSQWRIIGTCWYCAYAWGPHQGAFKHSSNLMIPCLNSVRVFWLEEELMDLI